MKNRHLAMILAEQISMSIIDICYINWDLYNPAVECDTEKLREIIEKELDEIFAPNLMKE